jgi:hypothetical protein
MPHRYATNVPAENTSCSVEVAAELRLTVEERIEFCFPGSMLVETPGGRTMAMESLKIGDFVKTSDSTFEEVSSFGHYDTHAVAEYVEINSSLRLSDGDHMVFLDIQHAITASKVALGDTLWLADGDHEEVKSNLLVKGKGPFAPFAPSGRIAVNGVVASNYVNNLPSGDQMLGFFNMQWMSHLSQAPHRLASFRMGIKNETYTTTGLSKWIASTQFDGAHWFLGQHVFVQAVVFVPAFAVQAVIDAIERKYQLLVAMVGAAIAFHFSSRKKKHKIGLIFCLV